MAIEYTTEQHGLICNLLHQAICEQRPEPDSIRRNWDSLAPRSEPSRWPSWRTC